MKLGFSYYQRKSVMLWMINYWCTFFIHIQIRTKVYKFTRYGSHSPWSQVISGTNITINTAVDSIMTRNQHFLSTIWIYCNIQFTPRKFKKIIRFKVKKVNFSIDSYVCSELLRKIISTTSSLSVQACVNKVYVLCVSLDECGSRVE